MSEKNKVVPRVVEAVAVSASRASATTSPAKKALSKAIEEAMSKAVTDCYKEGVTDPDKMRERMLAARESAKEKHHVAVTKALSEGNLEG